MYKILLYNQEIAFRPEEINEILFYKKADDIIEEQMKNIISVVNEDVNNSKKLAILLMTFHNNIYLNLSKLFVGSLRKNNIVGYDVTAEDFLALSDKYNHSLIDIAISLDNSYEEYLYQKKKEKTRRDIEKMTRGRLKGYGFGTGALKAMFVAGIANTASSIAYSAYNGVRGSLKNSDLKNKMDKEIRIALDKVPNAIKKDFIGAYNIYYDIMGYDTFFTESKIKQALNIKAAIDNGEVPPNEITEQVVEVIKRIPNSMELYLWAEKKTGKRDSGLVQLANLFKIKDYLFKVFSDEVPNMGINIGNNINKFHYIVYETFELGDDMIAVMGPEIEDENDNIVYFFRIIAMESGKIGLQELNHEEYEVAAKAYNEAKG